MTEIYSAPYWIAFTIRFNPDAMIDVDASDEYELASFVFCNWAAVEDVFMALCRENGVTAVTESIVIDRYAPEEEKVYLRGKAVRVLEL